MHALTRSPVLLLGEVLVILHRHVLLHVELREYLRDDDLVGLWATEVDPGHVGLPLLVLLDLLVEVADGLPRVFLQLHRYLGHDLFGLLVQVTSNVLQLIRR